MMKAGKWKIAFYETIKDDNVKSPQMRHVGLCRHPEGLKFTGSRPAPG
jgi:hypothetical protein